MLQNILFQISAVPLKFLFLQEFWKQMYHGFHKKYEASQQSSTLIRIINVSYNNAENVALNYRNKYNFTIYLHGKQLF